MRNKYRKMYDENFLGTSEISIVKYYYASFKLQQLRGKITNVTEYLQDCVKTSKHLNILLKMYGIFPFINIWLGTGKEQKKVAKVFEEKQKAVECLFLKDDISNEDVQLLLSDITSIPLIDRISREEAIEYTLNYIRWIYQSQNEYKQLGDRLFGYLIKGGLLTARTIEKAVKLWNEIFPNLGDPSNSKLLKKPEKNRNKNISRTIEELEKTADHFRKVQLHDVEQLVLKDLNNIKES